jgi:toxin YoeB
MKAVQFEESAYLDFINWATLNKIVFNKIIELIKDIDRNGTSKGIGKPEPLKYELRGYWSRRISGEHRFVYKVENEIIIIVHCKGHYK